MNDITPAGDSRPDLMQRDPEERIQELLEENSRLVLENRMWRGKARECDNFRDLHHEGLGKIARLTLELTKSNRANARHKRRLKRMQQERDIAKNGLIELSMCSGEPSNVENARILAARVRSVAARYLAEMKN